MSAKTICEKGISKPVNRLYSTPTDWISIPSISESEQKIYGVYAVYDSASNYVAISVTGAYTIDWGDGSATENIASGVTAEHNYVYGDLNISTLTSDGYKQALVTITPQAANSITTVNFNKRHSLLPYFTGSNWTSISMGSPSFTSILFGGSTQNIYYPLLEQVLIASTGTLTTVEYMFSQCRALRKVPMMSLGSSTSAAFMFNECNQLTEVPLYNTASITNMNSMFYACYSLSQAPIMNTASVTNMTSMFYNCSSLTKVPLYNTASVTSFISAFFNCTSLVKVPLFNTSTATSLRAMFSGCSKLVTIPKFITTLVTDTSAMFYGCKSLITIPQLSFNNLTTIGTNTAPETLYGGMFSYCQSLVSIPTFVNGATAITWFSGAFYGCESLLELPEITISGANSSTTATIGVSMITNCKKITRIPSSFNAWTSGTYNYMFVGCQSLRELPPITISTGTITQAASGGALFSMERNRVSGSIQASHSFNESPRLTKEALEEMFGNLTKSTVSKTLTIGACVGTTGVNAAISRSATSTAGSTTCSISNTASLVTGMLITGTEISTARSVSFQDSGDTVTLAAHGLVDNTKVSFSVITTTTGIATYTVYYVIGATTDTFQLSLTSGGSAIALTTNGTGSMLVPTYITNIVDNTSVTLSVPAMASGTSTLVFRTLDTSIATMRWWAISG